MDRRKHWDEVFGSKHAAEVSWYQAVPKQSLRLIEATGVSHDDAVIDVGGGASTLVDNLLEAGFGDVTVLDISENGLQQARNRLGSRANAINWVVADVTRFTPDRDYLLWHDRAVMHFLVDNEDRSRYVNILRQALSPGGSLVLATFGPEGPLKCSGLKIRRYNIEMLAELLGPGFDLQGHELDDHATPGGGIQQFLYSRWKRKA